MNTAPSFTGRVLKKNRRQKGFSLIELLVVALIFSIVMAAVLGTVSVATRTTRSNSQISEANQATRASLRLISNELSTTGEFFSRPNNFVMVRRGFLSSIGFPTNDVSIGPTPPNPGHDRLFAFQGSTVPGSAGAATLPGLTSMIIYGVTNTSTLPIPTSDNVDSQLRVYPGACGLDNIGTLYRTGTDQLLILQANPVLVNFRVPAPTAANPAATVDRIFPITGEYSAQVTYPSNDNRLVLVPNVAGPGPANLDPALVAPGANFVNPADRLLANRLQPFVDTVLVTLPNGGGNYLGVVTEVNTATGAITLNGNGTGPADAADEIGLTPPWRSFVTAGTSVNISRVSLVHYFIGWRSDLPEQPPVLYRKEGAFLSPVATGIENLQLSFDLIDELERVGIQKGILFSTQDLGLPPPTAGLVTPPVPARTSIDTRTMVRAVRINLFGRSVQQDQYLFGREGAFSSVFDRGFFHVSEKTTVGLRNFAYANTR